MSYLSFPCSSSDSSASSVFLMIELRRSCISGSSGAGLVLLLMVVVLVSSIEVVGVGSCVTPVVSGSIADPGNDMFKTGSSCSLITVSVRIGSTGSSEAVNGNASWSGCSLSSSFDSGTGSAPSSGSSAGSGAWSRSGAVVDVGGSCGTDATEPSVADSCCGTLPITEIQSSNLDAGAECWSWNDSGST